MAQVSKWRTPLVIIAAALIVIVGAAAALVLYQRHEYANRLRDLSLAHTLALAHALSAHGPVALPDVWPDELLQRALASEDKRAATSSGAPQAADHAKPPAAAMQALLQVGRQMAELHLQMTQMLSVSAWCKARHDGDRARETQMAAIWFAAQRDCTTAAACMQLARARAQQPALASAATSTAASASAQWAAKLPRTAAFALQPSVCPSILSAQRW